MEKKIEEEKGDKPKLRADGREILHWPQSGNPKFNCKFIDPYGIAVLKKKKVETQKEVERRGVAKLEPKVNEPYKPIPRRATREELLKRICETFKNANIEDILKKNHGVDLTIPDQSKLNFSFFDDKTYDIYPNDYWLDKAGKDKDGNQLMLQGKLLVFDKEKKTGTFKNVLISSYNKENDTFGGIFDEPDCKEPFNNIEKIFIHFKIENPFVWAKRLAEAIKLRNESENIIKYKYYLSKIPNFDVMQLPEDILEIIKKKIIILPEFNSIADKLQKEVDDVNSDYASQLNKMMFDDLFFNEKSSELCCQNLKIVAPEKPVIPKYAKEMIYDNNKDFNFSNLVKSYDLNTLQCKGNIIIALHKIKKIMNDMVINKNLYKVKFDRTLKLDEFLKEEKKSIYDYKKTIDNEIIASIKDILMKLQYQPLVDERAKLKAMTGNIAQGSLQVSNFEEEEIKKYPLLIDFITTRANKVRKFVFKEDQEKEQRNQEFMIQLNSYKTINLIKKINIMMRDALYENVVRSLIDFVSFFESNIPESSDVKSTNECINVYPDPQNKENRILNPADSKLKLSENCAFNKETEAPDSDLNTTYEIIDYVPEEKLIEMKKPIFKINLRYNNGNFSYHLQIDDVALEIKNIFDEGLEKAQKIEEISFEKKGYSNYKYFEVLRRDKTISLAQNQLNVQKENNQNNPNQENKNVNAGIIGLDQNSGKKEYDPTREDVLFVQKLYNRLGNILLKAKEPLEKFLLKFRQYKEDLDTKPDEYVSQYRDDEGAGNIGQIRSDIINHQRKKEMVLEEISEEVQVSYFLVNCKEVRETLIQKHDKIKELEIQILNNKSIEIKNNVFKQIEELKTGINRQPKSIEEIVEIERFIDEVPTRLTGIQAEIDSCLEIYKILNEFFQKIQFAEVKTRFSLVSCATDITNAKTAALDSLKKQRIRYKTNLEDSIKTLKTDIDNTIKKIDELKKYKSIDDLEPAAALAKKCEADLKDCQDRAKLCNSREKNFDMEPTDFSNLAIAAKEFNPFYLIWTSIDRFKKERETFKETPIKELDGIKVQDMNEQVKKHLATSIKALGDMQEQKEEELGGKPVPEDEDLTPLIKTATEARENSKKFQKVADLAVALTTKGLEQRHWEDLKKATNIDCTDQNKKITLNDIIGQEDTLQDSVINQAKAISDRANREFQIQAKLNMLNDNWKNIEFGTKPYRIQTISIITGWGDIYKVLDDDVQEVQQLEVNPFKDFFSEEINKWSTSLQKVTDVLEALSKLQSKWYQLQPIFESPDIAKSIPAETAQFGKAAAIYYNIVKGLKTCKNVKEVCNIEGQLENITEANVMLEKVEKGLNEYIEKKKLLFPRFYFLSNETLLKILSETKDLDRVKENLKNIFENIHNIELQNNIYIIKMISNLKEEVELKEVISIERKNIEEWMNQLESVMFQTVKEKMKICLEEYTRPPKKEWIFGHTSQSVVHSNQEKWTEQVEQSLLDKTGKEITDYAEEIQQRINLLVTILREPLNRIQGVTVFNLLTLEVHNKEITELFRTGEYDKNSFEWKKQLRYYWRSPEGSKDDVKDMWIESIQTNLAYGYEYLGNNEILVITPLTDKCYLTLMGAIKFNMGGAPAGPAGTGKTETTKDLAKSAAKQCVVYNCSEETDFVAVANFFKGLAFCGSWICFDEFNRINIEVLSVIASQLIQLFTAKAAGEEKITFEKTLIKILPTFCVFITMNPDYEGRTALPDNLVALFRPMAMMVPNYKLISEVYLYSSGYLKAKDLANKIVNSFKLCSEQLSSQSHYDFGMRAVKSVLYAAKKLKRKNHETPEDELLLRALKDVNVPKFLKEDIPLFNNIIKDLFPTTKQPESDVDDLMKCIRSNIDQMKLQQHPNFIAKIIQLYDTIQVRHGLMIVGPTGGGKSSNWKILSKSISDLAANDNGENRKYYPTKTKVINPKSIRKPQLYCEKDPQNPTDWINGILPITINELNKDTSGKNRYWILFDGPVDTFWIEDMNSVLDDSKRLCLPSSAIIVLNEGITMMFEVEDLVHASPATVSRCGMVFMEPTTIGLMPLAKSWIQTKLPSPLYSCPENCDIPKRLEFLFENCLEQNVEYLRKNIKEPCPTTDVNLAASLFKVIECFLNGIKSDSGGIGKGEFDYLYDNIINIYIMSTIWSIGITSSKEGRETFDKYFRNFIKNKKIFATELEFPEEKTIYDYFFDYNGQKWVDWEQKLSEQISSSKIEGRPEYTEIIIPTIDGVRYSYIIEMLLINKKHVISTGPTGTGKTINMNSVINNLESGNNKQTTNKFIQLIINFSAQTSACQTQWAIEKMLKRKGRGKYAPDNNKIMIVFVDDLNMPKKEKYEAQPPIEILRQWLDYEGWYDIKDENKQFISILNVILTGAMGPPGGGRSFLTNRFMRHFNLISYIELIDQSIQSIFDKKVNFFLAKFPQPIKDIIPALVKSTLDLYKTIKSKLLPIPKSSHYLFNLRDMSKVLQGVSGASLKHTQVKGDIVRLWMHEMIRCFGDRLICDEDRNWLKKILEDNIISTSAYEIKNVEDIYEGLEKILFCDFIASGLDRPYIQVKNIKDFISKIEDRLEEFNEEFKNKAMNLVMFLDACDHVARISRIIRQTQGNALLLGVGGSGRQSTARLSSFINYSMDCASIEVIKGYKLEDFRNDIKEFLRNTVCKESGKIQTCFLLCDTQIFDEVMLEDINNVLNSGDIPDIYKSEDFEEIKRVVGPEVKAKGLPDNQTSLMSLYTKKVLSKIHIILAMSPVGELFVTRLRMFPSLVNCCTIDWFTEWPEEALISVAKNILSKNEDLCLGKEINDIVESIKFIHKSVEKSSVSYLNELRRYNYLTPTSFLEFLNLFQNILVQKRKQNEDDISRYNTGLEVLQFAEAEISRIEKDIREQTPKLEAVSKTVEETIKQVEVKKAIADEVSEKALKDSQRAEALSISISKMEAECQKALSEALKTLENSISKIDKITDAQLQEVAGYKAYGALLCSILDVLLTFKCGNAWRTRKENLEAANDAKGTKQINYKAAAINDLNIKDAASFKQFFSEFKNEERRERLKDKEMDKVLAAEKLIKDGNLKVEDAEKASQAIGPCFDFIGGMIEFCHKSIEVVDPKKKEAAKAKELKAGADKDLAEANEKLSIALKESKDLEEKLKANQKQKNELIVQLNDNQTKVKRAKKLVELLSSEKERWKENVEKLKNYSVNILGDTLIAAGAIAYNGPFISRYRNDLENKWREKLEELNIKKSNDASLRSILEDKIETSKWTKCLLPNDNLSIENGIIMFKTSKWPLMIDPQNQASIFLKNYGRSDKNNSFTCFKMSNPKLMDNVISAVKFGKWVMIDNVGLTLENSLEPILQRQQVYDKISGQYTIKIGDKNITYSPKFKLFMITTLSNPHYSPETFAKITIINFAITEKGLEDQMLGELSMIEMPDLERTKNLIIEENSKNQEQLKQIEDKILDNLNKNKDCIAETLNSSELIDILSEAKQTATEISKKMEISEKTGKEIDEKREKYRSAAIRGSLLFFSLIDLAMIEPMYQFSLIQFKDLYRKTVKGLEAKDDLQERLKDINDSTSKALYEFTCRSLFEKDKQLFSFEMAVKIIMGEQEGTKKIKPTELRFLLAGPSSDIEYKLENNPTDWISPNDWSNFYGQLYGMNLLDEKLKDIHKDFMSNPKKFYPYFVSPKNEHTPLPEPYDKTLTDFQKLILIKALRFDKLTNELSYYVENNLGKEYTVPPAFSLETSYMDSSSSIPLLFVLSTGSDPKNDFQQLAEKFGRPTEYVSLGRSMDKVALTKIEEVKLKQGWILLQNCHLAISFMPKLEDAIEKLQDTISPDGGESMFRLWLTSMSTPKFSVNVLKSSIKITMEPPKGLKLNLQRQFENINEKDLEGCGLNEKTEEEKKDKGNKFKTFFFGLCFFHAIVQDRRKFGPIGWNIKYDFTNEDLKVSRMQLKDFLEKNTKVPYKDLKYLIAQINYGGRVTDDKDQRLIETILETYLDPKILGYEGYSFSKSGTYYCPKPGNKEHYLNYIKTLPLTTGPEVFGMHDNAEIITAQNDARLLLETMLFMQPRSSSGGGKSSEQIVMETLTIIERETPDVFDYEAIFKKFPTEYSESMNTVLIQEVIRYNVLLNLMKQNIKNLKDALSGRIVMNEELDRIVTSLYNNQVPKIWITSGFLSLKPLMSWIKDLNERIQFFNDWYKNGTPKCFCVSRFSFPQAFLTGTLQNFARKHKCEIDLLTFEFIIMDDVTPDKVTERPEDGCYAYGMYLEGARWNYEKHLLDDSLNRELYTDVPLMKMLPVKNRKQPDNVYETPLYKVLSRQGTLSTTGHSTNFVLMVELPTDRNKGDWVKAGVAMFLALKQ